jgi:hypothetical protein
VNRYGSYNVARSGFKYIHYYPTNLLGYLMARPKFFKKPKCGFENETTKKIWGTLLSSHHFLGRRAC